MFDITELLPIFPLATASWANLSLPACASLLVYILIIALRLALASWPLWPCVHAPAPPEVWFPHLGYSQEKRLGFVQPGEERASGFMRGWALALFFQTWVYILVLCPGVQRRKGA